MVLQTLWILANFQFLIYTLEEGQRSRYKAK
jgi:hypothetical protein